MKRINSKAILLIAICAVAIIGFACRGVSATVPGVNEGVDVNTSGAAPNNGASSYGGDMSLNGRYVLFGSTATDLVSSPTILSDNQGELYLRDRLNNTTTLVSVNASGDPANGNVGASAISATGRYVVYISSSNNLTSDYISGTNYNHVYLYDTQTGTTQIVDKDSSGGFQYSDRWADTPSVSADGKYVMFQYRSGDSTNLISSPSLTANTEYIFMKNVSTGAVTLLSANSSGAAANASSQWPFMDCNGDEVVFNSSATNLVSGGGSGTGNDVYLRNIVDGSITDITANANSGSIVSGISCSGDYVGVNTAATNLTSGTITSGHGNAYSYSRVDDDFTLLSQSSSGAQPYPGDCNEASISDDGKYAVFMCSNTTSLVSTSVAGNNVYLRNVETGTTELISENSSGVDGDGDSQAPVISADGRYVTYISRATNLIAGYHHEISPGSYSYLQYSSRTGASDDY